MAHLDLRYFHDQLDVKQLARIFGISCTSAYRLCRIPTFPARKVNRRWVIRNEELNQWIHTRKKK